MAVLTTNQALQSKLGSLVAPELKHAMPV
jgi:hypothetical protein